jgi:hypothetical protein
MAGNKATDREALLSRLAKIDPQRRPLFAAFLGDAIAHGSPKSGIAKPCSRSF